VCTKLTPLQVALKSFVDSLTIYAVQTCLLEKLSYIFTPEVVGSLSDETVQRIAGESEYSVAERGSLTQKLAALKDAQKMLHRLNLHQPTRKSFPINEEAIVLTRLCYRL
jgi:hypothetical protein